MARDTAAANSFFIMILTEANTASFDRLLHCLMMITSSWYALFVFVIVFDDAACGDVFDADFFDVVFNVDVLAVFLLIIFPPFFFVLPLSVFPFLSFFSLF